MATFDNTVISTSQNGSVSKTKLGNYKNLSLCVLECCDREDCDLALFDSDGNLCYGLLCLATNVCHFQSAKAGQRSYQAVMLSNAFKGRLTLLYVKPVTCALILESEGKLNRVMRKMFREQSTKG